MKNPFTHHPNHINETYVKHLLFAISSGLQMLAASVVFIIHGILPFVFTQSGSTLVNKLSKKLSTRLANNTDLHLVSNFSDEMSDN